MFTLVEDIKVKITLVFILKKKEPKKKIHRFQA